MDNKKIAKELGRVGGNSTLKKYGKKHYSQIAYKRWEKEKEKAKLASDLPIDK